MLKQALLGQNASESGPEQGFRDVKAGKPGALKAIKRRYSTIKAGFTRHAVFQALRAKVYAITVSSEAVDLSKR